MSKFHFHTREIGSVSIFDLIGKSGDQSDETPAKGLNVALPEGLQIVQEGWNPSVSKELSQEAPRTTCFGQPGFTQALPSTGARW